MIAIFALKCCICGGNIEYKQGQTVSQCEYCGSYNTLPHTDEEKRLHLIERARQYFCDYEFDMAAGIYESLLADDRTDPELYWRLLLCRCGVYYEKDTRSGRYIPTVNRTRFTPLSEDENCRRALEYADAEQRGIYEHRIEELQTIQDGILEAAAKEDPFDVFICYKELDESKMRTPDSLRAEEIYKELTKNGYKTFFSRYTLERKIGQQYEPIIYAALHSARVMLVVGCKKEHFIAPWVKNEWSRYIKIVQNDSQKALIPCFEGVVPDDLPPELNKPQAQDMTKIGFMLDLMHGIEKFFPDRVQRAGQTVTVQQTAQPVTAPTVQTLLERCFMFLADGEWDEANSYCDRVLDIEPKCGRAYLGKLMAELKVNSETALKNQPKPFDGSKYYTKVCSFDKTLGEKLKWDNDFIRERNETARKQGIYSKASALAAEAKTESEYKKAAAAFKSIPGNIPGFKDADVRAKQCLESAEVCRKEALYSSAKSKMSSEKAEPYAEAIEILKTIPGFKDVDEQICVCQKKIAEIKAKEEAERKEAERKAEEKRIAEEKAAKKRKKAFAIGIFIVAVCIAFVIILTTVIIPKQKFNKAMGLIDSGNYDSAYALLKEIGNDEAIASSKYDRAISLIDSGDYEPAYMLLNGLAYKDSDEKSDSIKPQYQQIVLEKANVGDTVYFGTYEQDDNTSNGKEDVEWIVLAKENEKALVISKYALDCQQYNTSYTDVTWESCSLRKWMNGTFLNNAFSAEEQAQIQNTTVSADKNPEYSTNPGNATKDKVFLLSITEVEKYFSSDSARQCKPTDYAVANGAYVNSGNGNCWWWLRSPGYTQGDAARVSDDGSVYCNGDYVHYVHDCVRPALWINLDS